jgi:glycosyltransferase involved in cell wall biosynthesis
MKEKFNILHVITRLPVGGVENMLFKVVTAYDKKRFNPIICCIKEGGDIADEFRKSGYNVEILNRMKNRGFDLGAVKGIYNLIKRDKIHILRTHQYHANLYGRLAGILAGVPVIIPSFHSRYESPQKPKLHRRLLNLLLSYFSDALVAVSSAVASDIAHYDRIAFHKIAVIYNGVILDKFNRNISRQEARKRFSLPSDMLIAGAVGRLKEEKGHRFLIEAVAELDNKMGIAIAGDGPLYDELENLAARLKVNCFFLGMVPADHIPDFLHAVDVFCSPSLWEGFGVTIIEAMAAGLPVIASDILSHKEVAGDAVMLVKTGEKDGIKEALHKMVDSPSLKNDLIKKAKERVKLFSIDNTVRAYEGLFGDILRKKGFE